NKRVGYAGNVRVNMDSRGRIGGGTDLNVRQDKVNVFVSGNVNQRKSLSWGTTDRLTLSNPKVRTLQDDNSMMKGLFGFGRAGIDYFINNRNTITLSGTMGRGSMRPSTSSDIYTDSLYSAVVNNYSQRNSSSKNEFRNMGTQLSYKHLFPKSGHEWTADITYNRGKNNNSNYIYTDYYKMPQQEFLRRYRQQQLGSGENKNLIVQTDYSKPINDKSKYEIGARATIRDVKSANNFYTVTSSGTLIPLPGQNILYNSKDRVYAAYATYTNRIKNFGYQLGIRAESSDYNGVLPNKGQSFTIKFPLSLFPSVFLTQRVNETDDLQFNYSRRINRPNFWQLFPFTDYSDSLNISRGNPNLKPEFTNSLELSYSKIFKNRDNFIASLYFKNTNDLITRFQTLEQDTFLKRDIIVSTFINANRSYITGLELTARNKLTKFWDLTSNANFFTAKIDLKNEKDPDQFLSYFIKINNTFRLPKNFTLQLSGDYQSRIISSPGSGGGGFGGGGGGRGGGFGNSSAAQGYIRPNYGVDAALRFEFLKNRTASLSLNFNDIFRTRMYSAHTESQFFIQDIERRRDPQVARLNFNWRFGKMDISLFKRRNNRTENEDMDNTNF
ncbi:MAG: TonB-dependent receptor family protein, partial [Flavisolibacter sp.]|nr:TonB-dependent receptor family protein [Flavisolibacter sp.]